ncbi:MAG: rRNA adenine N-6-methyltransferase family protein, partial [Acidimicrobiales bacterium]
MSPSRSDLQRLLAEHDIRPSKALGQNFVTDQNTLDRIVRLAELAQIGTVVEVGAGLGSLTLALAGAAAPVLAIEIDKRIAAVLEQVVAGLDVEVV